MNTVRIGAPQVTRNDLSNPQNYRRTQLDKNSRNRQNPDYALRQGNEFRKT
jgi:hypothetical protein